MQLVLVFAVGDDSRFEAFLLVQDFLFQLCNVPLVLNFLKHFILSFLVDITHYSLQALIAAGLGIMKLVHGAVLALLSIIFFCRSDQ